MLTIISGLHIRCFELKTKYGKECRDLQNVLMAILPSGRENNAVPLSSWGKT